jgi:hypothetical protein
MVVNPRASMYALQSAPVTPSFTRHSHPRALNLRAFLEKLGAVSSNYQAPDRKVDQNIPARAGSSSGGWSSGSEPFTALPCLCRPNRFWPQ